MHLRTLFSTMALTFAFAAAGCEQRSTSAACPERDASDASLFADVVTSRGNPSRTGEQLDSGPQRDPAIRWKFESRELVSDPLVANGLVWTSTAAEIISFSAPNGLPVGKVTPGSGATPTLLDQVLFFSTRGGAIYAFDFVAGQAKWQVDVDNVVISGPTLAGESVYVGTGMISDAGSVYALDAKTGDERWRYVLPLSSGEFEDGVMSDLAVAGNLVFIVTGHGTIFALDAITGEKCWESSVNLGGIMVNPPVVADEKIFIGASETGKNNDKLYSIDAKTGKRLWSFEHGGGRSSPAVARGVVYTGSDNGNLYAVGARSGEQKWSFEAGNFEWSSPVIAGDVVYAASQDGFIYAIDAVTGTQQWRLAIGEAKSAVPAVAGGIVYVRSENGLYAIGEA